MVFRNLSVTCIQRDVEHSSRPLFVAIILIVHVILLLSPVHADDIKGEAMPFRYQEGLKLLKEKKWAEAAVILKSANQNYPQFSPAILGLSEALVHLDRREEAVRLLEKSAVASKKPKTKAFLRRRAQVMSRLFLTKETFQIYQEGLNLLQLHRYKEAKEKLKSALDQEKDNVDILIRMGQCHVLMDDPHSALESFYLARQLDPEEPELALWMSRTFFIRGEKEKALQELKSVEKKMTTSELYPVWLSEVLLSLSKSQDAIDVLKQDMNKNPLHLLTILTWVDLKNQSFALDSRQLWECRKNLQLALSRYDEYAQSLQEHRFETELGFTPHRAEDVQKRIKIALIDADSRIQNHESR